MISILLESNCNDLLKETKELLTDSHKIKKPWANQKVFLGLNIKQAAGSSAKLFLNGCVESMCDDLGIEE